MPERSEPYKQFQKAEIWPVPPSIEVLPKTDKEIVRVARYSFESTLDQATVLPPQYGQLEEWLRSAYEAQYSRNTGIDITPLPYDYLFQQYAIKMDERNFRTGVDTFGTFAISYLDGLRTMGVEQGYLGSSGWSHIVKDQYRALLLGSSSISTADDFYRFMEAVNPKAMAIVTDIDPLAVQLAKEALSGWPQEQVLQSDAQRIPLKDGSVDFIATNFLTTNLIDVEGSGLKTVENVLKEAGRVLSPEGRLIMVEQLDRIGLEWVNEWASRGGLVLTGGGPEAGILRIAYLKSHRYVKDLFSGLPDFIEESAREVAYKQVRDFTRDPRQDLGGKPCPWVSTLIFKKRRPEGEW